MALNVHGINSASVGAFLVQARVVPRHLSLAQRDYGSVCEHLRSFPGIERVFADESNGLARSKTAFVWFLKKTGAAGCLTSDC